MRALHKGQRRLLLSVIYVAATLQLVWCYLRIVHPYMNVKLYEAGTDRMPFQGRVMMMLPMRWADHSVVLHWLLSHSWRSVYWFPGPMTTQAIVEAAIDVISIAVAGWMTVKLYQASSRRRWFTPAIYPLFLAAFTATYVLHTVQNFRFFYDPPSLAFFAIAMYLIYTRRHWGWFAALFLVATVNRETTLLLLPLYMIDRACEDGRLVWRRLFAPRVLALVVPLALVWCAWTAGIHLHFAANKSEFYPRFDWNLKSLAYPPAWPQMLSPCGFLLLYVVVRYRKISDARLRTWLWLLPIWLVFMFTYGILIEVRIWGELIPFVVCTASVILEEQLAARIGSEPVQVSISIAQPSHEAVEAEQDVAQAA
ncbi:MAG TPA: hypothetical protein VG714_02605 [Acidobacteriaceae bacterium]|nr:hypothetical protein [Acidobacteriaceae bacterium]